MGRCECGQTRRLTAVGKPLSALISVGRGQLRTVAQSVTSGIYTILSRQLVGSWSSSELQEPTWMKLQEFWCCRTASPFYNLPVEGIKLLWLNPLTDVETASTQLHVPVETCRNVYVDQHLINRVND